MFFIPLNIRGCIVIYRKIGNGIRVEAQRRLIAICDIKHMTSLLEPIRKLL